MPTLFEVPLIEIGEASFKIRTVLETVQLVLRFDWVTRIERWNLSIFDNSENPLVLGLTMNINNELIARFEIPGLPPGKLILYDTSTNNQEAGLDDLGDRCRLFYETSV